MFRATSAFWACAPLLLMVVGVMAYSTALTQLINKKVCSQSFTISNASLCDSNALANAEASRLASYAQVASSAPSLLVAGTFGAGSDHIGRKPFLVLTVIGMLADVLWALWVEFMDLPIGTVLLGRIFYGICGGLPVFLGQVFAFVADITESELRHQRFVALEAVLFAGGILASLGGGWLLTHCGYVTVFVVIAACHVLNLVIILATSLPVKSASLAQIGWGDGPLSGFLRTNTAVALVQVFLMGSSPAWLIVTFFLFLTAYFGWFLVLIEYGKHVWHWNAETIGEFQATEGGFRTINLVFYSTGFYRRVAALLRVDCFVVSDLSAVRICLVSGVAGFLVYASATHPAAFFFGTPLSGGLMLAVPLVRAMFSRSVDETGQGKVLSAVAALESTVGMCGPAVFGYIWSITLDSRCLLCMSATVLLALVTSAGVKFDPANGGLSPNMALHDGNVAGRDESPALSKVDVFIDDGSISALQDPLL